MIVERRGETIQEAHLRNLRNLECWKSRPDPYEEAERELEEERWALGLDCPIAVMDARYGRLRSSHNGC